MEPPRFSSRGVSDEVTREEIAQTERILGLIEINHAVLSNVSQWLLIWSGIRDLSLRFSRSTEETRRKVSGDFKGLLEDASRLGRKLTTLAAELNLEPGQIVLATGCDLSSVDACIEFLNDKLIQWFDSSVSEEKVHSIWKEQADGPVPVV